MDVPGQSRTAHRADVDGLRAIAVLAVLAYHGNALWLPGGFVGVDIFFVISGYLISCIILAGLQRGSFSFADFYARRIKRIFPALVIVLAFVLLFGWYSLFADEFQLLGEHVAASAGFVLNIVLRGEAGYFDTDAALKPLLHLWSLGIEEQFYLVWPLLFFVVSRRGISPLAVIVAITLVSFALNVQRIAAHTTGTFYLPPTRLWELSLGSVLAYAQVQGAQHAGTPLGRVLGTLRGDATSAVHSAQAASGLLLLLIASVGLTNNDLFPGWWALLPTVGAFLLIAAGERTWINRRILGSRPLVFVGLISYPLYLWHWPLLSFQRIMSQGVISTDAILYTLALAFVLAWLTYRFIERPIRSSRLRLKPSLLLAAGIAGLGALGYLCLLQSIPARSARYGLDYIVAARAARAFPGPNLRRISDEAAPLWKQGQARETVLFLGDSNVEQYYPRIDWLLTHNPAGTKSVVFGAGGGCPPLPNVKEVRHPNCVGIIERGERLARDPDVDTVVIAARWTGYFMERNHYYFEDASAKGPILLGSATADKALNAFESLVTRLTRSGKSVFIVLPIPTGEQFKPRRLIRRMSWDFSFQVHEPHITKAEVVAYLRPIVSRLQQIAKHSGATLIDPVASVCTELECPEITPQGQLVNRDGYHLNPAYVIEHVRFLDALLLRHEHRQSPDAAAAPSPAKRL
jgi:peptidoglycan/LPS O-acetylase OafA/YrhL